MNADCVTCGALWRRHSLSSQDPNCATCDIRVCTKCASVSCFKCDRIMHDKCARRISEDFFCNDCYKARIRKLLDNKALSEQMLASLAWEIRRSTG